MLNRLQRLALALLSTLALAASAEERAAASELIARGRYMVLGGHCNNCHTAGYMSSAGKVPE